MQDQLIQFQAVAREFLREIEHDYTSTAESLRDEAMKRYRAEQSLNRSENEWLWPGLIEPTETLSSYIEVSVFIRNNLTPEQQQRSTNLRIEAKGILVGISKILRNSPLLTEVDFRDLSVYSKTIAAAVQFRRFFYQESNAVTDEDGVFRYAELPRQDEEIATFGEVIDSLNYAVGKVCELLEYKDPQERSGSDSLSVNLQPIGRSSQNTVPRYRPNTAFIMMRIDPKDPTDEDLISKIVSVFKKFGVSAVRADQILHDGPITNRILEEIATSEFLFADLTGERPSVYYEVGFAHALNKRVMLCRKESVKIHFDLANHNCPEYKNLTDLEKQLATKLEAYGLVRSYSQTD